jgi:hypothetical protein
VVVSNLAGVLASTDAGLTVTLPPPPHIDDITLLSSGQIQLQVSGSPGHYSIEATTNLVDWDELTNINTTGTSFDYIDPGTNLTQRFYRVRLLP